MRFSKVYITTKPGMYGEMKGKIEKFLAERGVDFTDMIEPHINLAVTIGGDGTLLRAQNKLSCPFFGINGGDSVGYYLCAGPQDYLKKLELAIFGYEGREYEMLRLMRLSASINDKQIKEKALNEMVVSAVYTRSMLRAQLTVNGETSLEMNTGILAYTPTGSFAYASSAGAGVMDPKDKRFGVCAIAPYAGRMKEGEILTDGEVSVIPLNSVAELSVDGQDGQSYKIEEGDIVVIKKAQRPLRLIWFGDENLETQ